MRTALPRMQPTGPGSGPGTTAREAMSNPQTSLDELRARLASGDASDGYHTHNELYQYRMLYNVHTLHAFNAVGWEVTRSWKHSDGETCFGGGWFVVHAETPAGQITNHYAAEHWHLFGGITEALTAPEWDRHTPSEAAQRLEAAILLLRQRFAEIKRHTNLLQRAYEQARDQRDKYMRRTIEWREAAMNSTTTIVACTGCANGCEGCRK